MKRCSFCDGLFIPDSICKECSTKCRILSKVKNINGCWEWQGKIGKNGYGHIKIKQKDFMPHRLMYQEYNGELEPGKIVMHLCHNRKCCNPEHLIQGTQKQNVHHAMNSGIQYGSKGHKWTEERRKKILKNRKKPDKRGEKHHLSYLTDKEVLEIKKMLHEGKRPREILPIYNITRQHLYSIKIGKLWSHIKLKEETVKL